MQEWKTGELARVAELFKVLAHPVRIRTLELLGDGDINLRELNQHLGCSQSLLSQHIRILRDRGLIQCRKTGTSKYCAVPNRCVRQLILQARNCLHAGYSDVKVMDGGTLMWPGKLIKG